MPVFKLWSSNLKTKKLVSINEYSMTEIIQKANEKNIYGSKIFLLDGTEVEDDDILIELQKEVLIIGDSWKPDDQSDDQSARATTSATTIPNSPTATIVSNISEWSTNSTVLDITYDKLPTSLLRKLNDLEPVSNAEVNNIVRILTDEVLQKAKQPTRSVYRTVAKDLCDKFPQLYDKDADTKELIGTGYFTIFKKIEERVHYLQRPNNILKGGVCDDGLGTPKETRKRLNLSAGCKEWQPSDPDSEDLETLKYKKNWLKSNSYIKDREEVRVELYMQETYSQQRKFLNSTPAIPRIVEEWPVLFEEKYMISHFDRLCALNFDQCMEAFQNKTATLNERLKALVSKKALEQSPHSGNDFIDNIWLIAVYFKEDISHVYQSDKKPLTKAEVADLPKVAAPNIVFSDIENIYYLLVEKNIVSETAGCPRSLQLLVAAYFNFNLEYPVECQNTLEFLQRYVFKINPKEGSKIRKGRTLKKVLSLMSKLKLE